MKFNIINRRVHYWASFAAALPLLVIIATGILLQAKKHWTWVQRPERRGTGSSPQLDFDGILSSVRQVPSLGVHGWDDVNRLDVRPSRGMVKVWLNNLGTGRVLQTPYRRADLIETIHDGSFFGGDWTKLGLFLPAGLVPLMLWFSGMWMWWVPFIAKRRRAAGRAAIAHRGTGPAASTD